MHETHQSLVTPEFCGRLRQGDDTAWDQVVQNLAPTLLTFAARQLGTWKKRTAEPEDFVQETWIYAKSHAAAFQGTCYWSLRNWLRSILWSELRKEFRKKQRESTSLDQPSGDGRPGPKDEKKDDQPLPPQVLLNRELIAVVCICSKNLTQDEKEVLHLRYWEGLSYDEIAAAMNVKVDRAKYLHRRALHKIELQLKKYLEEP
ncbi:MAG TPA: hypothetical protein DDY91_01935 [Planctomycetaceae bacterium]|nr:hypothetical protein [Planctomycetaceae bacterium]